MTHHTSLYRFDCKIGGKPLRSLGNDGPYLESTPMLLSCAIGALTILQTLYPSLILFFAFIPVILWACYQYPEILLGYYIAGAAVFQFIMLSMGFQSGTFRYLFLLSFGSVFLFYLRNRFNFQQIVGDRYVQLLLPLYILFCISLITSDYYALGLDRLAEFTIHGILPSIAIMSMQEEKRLINLSLGFVIIGVAMAFLMQQTYSISQMVYFGRIRLSVMEINPITIGRTIGVGVVFCALLISMCRRTLIRICLAGLVLFQVWGMLLTGTRQVLLSLIFCFPLSGLILWIMRGKSLMNWRTALRFTLIGTSTIIAVVALYMILPESVTWRYVAFLDDPTGDQGVVRFELWKLGLQLYTHSSFLFGSGICGFYSVSNEGSAHNIFVEFLSEYGMIGLMIFILFVVHVARTVSRSQTPVMKNRQTMLAFAVFTAFTYFFIVAQFSGNLANNAMLWCFAAMVCRNSSLLK